MSIPGNKFALLINKSPVSGRMQYSTVRRTRVGISERKVTPFNRNIKNVKLENQVNSKMLKRQFISCKEFDIKRHSFF